MRFLDRRLNDESSNDQTSDYTMNSVSRFKIKLVSCIYLKKKCDSSAEDSMMKAQTLKDPNLQSKFNSKPILPRFSNALARRAREFSAAMTDTRP